MLFYHSILFIISAEIDLKVSMVLWMILGVCVASLFYRKQWRKKMFPVVGVLAIVRSLITLGTQPTLTILGLGQVMVDETQRL